MFKEISQRILPKPPLISASFHETNVSQFTNTMKNEMPVSPVIGRLLSFGHTPRTCTFGVHTGEFSLHFLLRI
jgi:hypothetical protein